MKGKIDNSGVLDIVRRNKSKRMYCPFQQDVSACGDWCPLFSEPIYTAWGHNDDGDYVIISICNNHVLEFTEFTDERE